MMWKIKSAVKFGFAPSILAFGVLFELMSRLAERVGHLVENH